MRIVRVSLALAVAFWMAGAGCMLGCENMVSAVASTDIKSPANSPIIVAAGDACASRQSHDCCAKHRAQSAAKPAPKAAAKSVSDKLQFVADSRKEILGQSLATMMDCPLAVNATAALARVGSDQASVALPSSSERASLSNPPEQTSAFARRLLRLPNRGHTYLRCCVFLI